MHGLQRAFAAAIFRMPPPVPFMVHMPHFSARWRFCAPAGGQNDSADAISTFGVCRAAAAQGQEGPACAGAGASARARPSPGPGKVL